MKYLALGAFALATIASGAAQAQTAAANITHGAPIAGVCVYDNEGARARSTAGQSVQTGMERLVQEVRGELTPYMTAIQTESQQLEQGGAAADPNGTRHTALQARAQEFQQLNQMRTNELQYTQAVQVQAIDAAAEPIVVALYQERGCSILLNRAGVYSLNPAMDITNDVVQRLNTALPSLSFNRMPVPVQPQS